MSYIYIRGRVYVADRDSTTGEPLILTDLGDTCDVALKLATEFIENRTNSEAISSLDARVAQYVGGTGTLKCKSDAAKVLAMALFGSIVEETGGAFTAEAFPSGMVVGGTYRLPNGRCKLSALTITDSAGSPATLTLGTHYSQDLVNGTITIISLTAGGAKTQPLKAAGTEITAQQSIVMLSARSQEKFLMVHGVNIMDSDKPVIIDLYKTSFGPASDFMLKGSGNDPQEHAFEFTMLKDPLRAASATFGQYGRYRKLTQ